jgi:hypothetical protein
MYPCASNVERVSEARVEMRRDVALSPWCKMKGVVKEAQMMEAWRRRTIGSQKRGIVGLGVVPG